ncbi:apoptosis facilitator Bcl-2-like protein 14 [Caloenas nicobarica]|uniref:apoptosis facilitator Bcl-2-like protein 14 n=1 Tax=Caloenas nicobarica TaxID=187106 RepID=UPI0032B7A754
MSSPNDETLLEDDDQDSIEYKILMAYAQRRLSVRKYVKLLKNEANTQKSSSLMRREVEVDHQTDEDGPNQGIINFQRHMIEAQSKTQLKGKSLPVYGGRAEQENVPILPLVHYQGAHFSVCKAQSESPQEGNSQRQTSERAYVNRIADKLARLVTSRIQEFPILAWFQGPSVKQYDSDGKEYDEEMIQKIVSLLRQSGDELEEMIKKDRTFYQHFEDMLSYTFFKRIADMFLEYAIRDSPSEPESRVQCAKVAFTMEVATRLNAVDNHPMNLVLGFGLKYLREHFKPWIQDQGGWEKALASLDEEEVE